LLGRIAGEVEGGTVVRNIPFCREEYTFCSKGIYYSPEGYILFAPRVYTLLQDGIFLFLGRFLRAQIKMGEKTQKGLSLSFRRRESPWSKVR